MKDTIEANKIDLLEEEEDFNFDDDEVQKDAANDVVAFMVLSALSLFLFLFFVAAVFIIIIVGKYGFLVFIILSVLSTFVIIFVRFTLGVIEKDRVLRPMKKKMRRWHAIATAVIVNEMKNFHLDLNDHLLLTYDDNYNDDDGTKNNDHSSSRDNNNRKWKKPRSRIFRIFVQPFLKKKNGNKRFSKSNKTKNNDKFDVEPNGVDDCPLV